MPGPTEFRLTQFNTVDPNTPAHALPDDTVATATNIDFSMGGGALMPRRGVTVDGTIAASADYLYRNNNTDLFDGKFYAIDTAGVVWRGTAGTWTAVATGAATQGYGFASAGTYAYIAAGTNYVKDDGTHTTDWIKQVPDAPTIVINSLAPISFSTNSVTVEEGSALGTDTATVTAIPSDANRIAYQVGLVASTATVGLDVTVNGTSTVGNYGVYFIDLAFDDPTQVARISQDWSIGDASFANCWHMDLFPQNALVPFTDGTPVVASAQPDPNQLIDDLIGAGTAAPPTIEDRNTITSAIRTNNGPPGSLITRLQNTFAPWAVPITQFTFVGSNTSTDGSNGWTNVFAVRYTIELNATTTATIRNPQIFGAQDFSLTDVNVGYTWWQTWATLDSGGNKIGESAPSPATAPLTMQNANVTVTQTASATGTAHGLNATITYRQGGMMGDSYAVATSTYPTPTVLDTMADIDALNANFVMPRNIRTLGLMPGDVTTLAYLQDRIWAAGGDPRILYSLPGVVDSFPLDSFITVSHYGDEPQVLLAWPPGLVIINIHSVYELQGTDFEHGQWTITKMGSRHGSLAKRVPVPTPYGIPMLNADGLFLYIPGEGIDQEIAWLNDRYGDMFKGAETFNPAALKGNRIPALVTGLIFQASCAYGEGKIFLAGATGTDTVAKTVYVIDMMNKRCWWYRYAFGITDLYWDSTLRRLFATSVDGKMMRLENNTLDEATTSGFSGIPWTATTKRWSTQNDTVLEHCWTEVQAPQAITVQANLDGTAITDAVSVSSRAWSYTALNGHFNNGLDFTLSGTATGSPISSVFQLTCDLLVEPPQVFYWRSDYAQQQSDNDKLWDVAYYDVASRLADATEIVAVTFIDGAAVMTNTITATTGRKTFMQAFPATTYGRVAVTTYSSTALFQIWDTEFATRPEPPLITFYRSDVTSLEENICDAFDVDINPGGTTTAVCYVDNVAVSTQVVVGSVQQSYTLTLPNEQYGRTIYCTFNGGPFKMYRTWFHLRPEPDRWTNFVTPKISGPEHEWKTFTPELNCLGNTVLATSFVEGTAVATFTLTGTGRQQYSLSMPIRTFGRTIWTVYNAGSGHFKRYPAEQPALEYEGNPEPSRETQYRIGPHPYPSSHYLRTWSPRLDCLGNSVVGTLICDNVVLASSTFTGSTQQFYTVGLDLDGSNALETASRWEAVYSGGPFKHYETNVETEAKPFGKSVWSFAYTKSGGATQLDMPRFWSIDAEAAGTATFTYFWDIDSQQFTTGTLVLTGGPQWIDRIPFPPGGRGRLFQFRFQGGANNVKVGKVNLDFVQEGIKGLARRENDGTPQRAFSNDSQQ